MSDLELLARLLAWTIGPRDMADADTHAWLAAHEAEGAGDVGDEHYHWRCAQAGITIRPVGGPARLIPWPSLAQTALF